MATKKNPPQKQHRQPGLQSEMVPKPESIRASYRGSGKLEGKAALITGGDSGIGRSVAVHFAREGADVAIAYLDEDDDARETERLVKAEGVECLLIRSDLAKQSNCLKVVDRVASKFGRLDVLVNNHAMQWQRDDADELTPERLEKTFATNLFSFFYLVGAAIEHLPRGGSIINSGSVTGVRGNDQLLDYAATKGAIHAMTFSLARKYAERGVRVNAVAPGPIWTPLIPASFDAKKVSEFGSNTLMGRAGQPSECGPAYVFLACDDSSFITGQLIHVNGGSHMSA
jgi:NAD(P)-dependent dehydrogenase (short-subunit alcohol dehydrogenase family)